MSSDRIFCNEKGDCFAKIVSFQYLKSTCSILCDGYPEGCCPFKKKQREMTNGKFYPWISADALIMKRGKSV